MALSTLYIVAFVFQYEWTETKCVAKLTCWQINPQTTSLWIFLLNEMINILIVQIIFSPLPTTEAKSTLSEGQ